MKSGRFNLLFRGEVLDAFTPEQVKKGIVERFGKDPDQVEGLYPNFRPFGALLIFEKTLTTPTMTIAVIFGIFATP